MFRSTSEIDNERHE
jgi:hypothetical protein